MHKHTYIYTYIYIYIYTCHNMLIYRYKNTLVTNDKA